jgi:hypothetical protein
MKGNQAPPIIGVSAVILRRRHAPCQGVHQKAVLEEGRERASEMGPCLRSRREPGPPGLKPAGRSRLPAPDR